MSLSACSGCAAKYRSEYAISVYPDVRERLITAFRNAHIIPFLSDYIALVRRLGRSKRNPYVSTLENVRVIMNTSQ